MTPREAVDIYRKSMGKSHEIDFLCQTKNYFAFYTEKDKGGCRAPSYYVDKNTGALIDGLHPSPEMAKAWSEGLKEEVTLSSFIPASEYL
ncbi:MAG: hypothetical protein ACOX9E_07595 [Lentisphaeria bacterium]|jgi:lysophospholipase L1-like esterase